MSLSTRVRPDQTRGSAPATGATVRAGGRVAPKSAAVSKWDWTELDGTPALLNTNRSAGQKGSAAVYDEDGTEAAYRRGVADGREALQATVCRELELAKSAALSAVEEVRKHSEAWAARLQDNLVALAVGIARQIVEREVDEDPEIFLALARKAVAAFPVDQPVKVRLHPDDLALLVEGGARANESSISIGDRMVPWVSDEETVRGGCLVQGPVKIVDGRLDEALKRVYRTLTNG